jgi:hypothetical protein
MPKNTPPLSLSQVLEAEYAKIHKATPPEYPGDAGESDKRAFLFKLIHALPRGRSALCISGGGILEIVFY